MPTVTPPTAFEDDPSKKPRVGVGKSKKSQRPLNDGKKTSVSEERKRGTAEEEIGEVGEVGDIK